MKPARPPRRPPPAAGARRDAAPPDPPRSPGQPSRRKPSHATRSEPTAPQQPPAQRRQPPAQHGQAPAQRDQPPAQRSQPPARRRPPDASRDVQSPRPDAEATGAGGEGVRLSKRLGELGLASRREADEWIEAGRVRVNGRPAVLGQRVLPGDRIDVDPSARAQQARRVTVLLNKPIGVVSAQAEGGYSPAAALITAERRWSEDRAALPVPPARLRGLAPAGRLDIDSTGLLVLTQDGRVARRLIGEDSTIEKEYLVRVQPLRPLADDALELLRHGLELDGRPLKPAKVSWANEDQLRVVLREGRKRQIRRMCELVGLQVTALRRVRIGRVVLGKLPPGQWRVLRDDERF